MMIAENAGGVRRSLAHDESAQEKQTPLTLRNEAQLNCVSLRPEFDCEVTWGAVKGQDERPLRGALDSSPSHHRRFGKELIKDGRHVGLDFLRPSHRSIQTVSRPLLPAPITWSRAICGIFRDSVRKTRSKRHVSLSGLWRLT